MVACIATWSFGLQSVKIAAGLLNDGGDCVDVVETAVSCKLSRPNVSLVNFDCT